MNKGIINKLLNTHSLKIDEYKQLIENYRDFSDTLAKAAVELRKSVYSNKIYIRGLIEISNICKNDCFYCGLRKSNLKCERYRLGEDDILSCVCEGYGLGFRTFVFQGGEDAHFTDDILCGLIKKIKQNYPDCAVTLSLGERSYESYKRLHNAGADRYLLRHETANCTHYSTLHPKDMSYNNRIRCLNDLRASGYRVGCGFMVGSPYQTTENIAEDLKFIEMFSPDMCGIGPFIPHRDTPFGEFEPGSCDLTCFLISVIRIIKPNILLPSTTALATLSPSGREKGILSGANVIMPNLSPQSVRKKYEIYNNKLSSGKESALEIDSIKKSMLSIGYEVVTDIGDIVM